MSEFNLQASYVKDTNTEDDLYYRRDRCFDEVYAKDSSGIESYVVRNGRLYPAKDCRGRPKYAKDATGHKYYYREDNGFEHVFMYKGKTLYVVLDGKEVYPKDSEGGEIVVGRYAENEYGIQYYPKDKSGNDYVDKVLGYILFEGAVIYPWYEGQPIYNPKDYYVKQQVAGTTESERIYNVLVRKLKTLEDTRPVYAYNAQGSVIFPKDEYRNESYVKFQGADFLEGVNRYAVANDVEFYPREASGKEGVINGKYANIGRYPIDDCGNEYMIYEDKPYGNPITRDGYEIVRKVKRNEKIRGLLSNRPGDYVTDVKTRDKLRIKGGPSRCFLPLPDWLVSNVKMNSDSGSFFMSYKAAVVAILLAAIAWLAKWLSTKRGV